VSQLGCTPHERFPALTFSWYSPILKLKSSVRWGRAGDYRIVDRSVK
jgi:hypothetical protein